MLNEHYSDWEQYLEYNLNMNVYLTILLNHFLDQLLKTVARLKLYKVIRSYFFFIIFNLFEIRYNTLY